MTKVNKLRVVVLQLMMMPEKNPYKSFRRRKKDQKVRLPNQKIKPKGKA
jgi:hypothetical protein